MLSELELRLMWVNRWGVVHTVKQQSVAEHCYFVARIAQSLVKILKIENPWIMLEIMGYALRHDDLESLTNDIPSNIKPAFSSDFIGFMYREDLPEHEQPSVQAVRVVKLADLIEAATFMMMEYSIGNKSILLHILSMEHKLNKYCEAFDMMIVWHEYVKWRNGLFPKYQMAQQTYAKENIRGTEQSTTESTGDK